MTQSVPNANTSRRRFFSTAAATGVATLALGSQATPNARAQGSPNSPLPSVRYCLNTSTIHGQEIDFIDQINIAADAGYDGIEIWLRDVEKFVQSGGNLVAARDLLSERNLKVESAIAFAKWIVDDDAEREEGMRVAARDMDVVRRLGGHRIAAPPIGATNGNELDLDQVAQRYAQLCDLGRRYDVVPQLEVWGFSKNLSKLSEVLYVLAESKHVDACLLPDVYHLYKGGSNFVDLQLVNPSKIHVFHMNDYPLAKPIADIGDADRVYPTDGNAPLTAILGGLFDGGFQGVLSLELFNRSYWELDPLDVAKTGLAKMKAAVANATTA
jgi:sugar phosphate isomerase/epimerase